MKEILRHKLTALHGREILRLKLAALHGTEILRLLPISLLDAYHGNGVEPSEKSHINKKESLHSKCITKFVKRGKAPGYADAR
jgi:hypothetical protein